MKFKHLLTILAFVSASLIASVSYAAGQITGVSAPSSAVQGSSVRITVIGRGTCGSHVSFGDGMSYGFANHAFPHIYTHRYTRTGTMTIRVRVTGAGCSAPESGSPSTRITILARITKLPNVGKVRTRNISPGKLQPRKRFTPTLNKQQRGAIRASLVTCMGRRVTIVGTPGHDRILGTPGNDVIHGLGGYDDIHGLGGDDIICGGPGGDKLYGDGGNDKLYGGAGNDTLIGGRGNDRLYGMSGSDRLSGGPGNDFIYGGPGHDWLWGESGDDHCNGGSGFDRLTIDSSCEIQNNIP